jgi:hypothetical protein
MMYGKEREKTFYYNWQPNKSCSNDSTTRTGVSRSSVVKAGRSGTEVPLSFFIRQRNCEGVF